MDFRKLASTPARNVKATAYIFVGIDCPISNSYAPEINRIIADYSSQGIAFYLVYSDSAATEETVRKHVRDFGYTCPAVLDRQHAFAQFVHATVTPEAAVLSPDNQLLYRGRIDDLYADLGKRRYNATMHDLRIALDAIVHNQPVATKFTKAIGCEL